MKTLPLALGLTGLVAAGTFATLYVRSSSSRRALIVDLAATRARAAALDTQLAAATVQSTALEQRLTELDVDLGATKTRLTRSDSRNIQLSRELVRARADLATHTQSEQALRDELAALTRDRPVQISAAAAVTTPASPDALDAYKTVIADLERQLADAQRVTPQPLLVAEPPAFPGPPAPSVPPVASDFPPKPAASVVGVGPANAFVILDHGAGRGMATGQVCAIRRGLETVALARVTDVRPRFAIAHVQPNSLRGVLQKGDSAVITD